MDTSNLRTQATPFFRGAAVGAIALAIVGFTWGGWVTGGTAERLASGRADAAIVAALTPICVAQFQKGDDAAAKLAALKEIESWKQGDYVGKSGWATMPGSTAEPNRDVATACAEQLNKLVL